MHVLEVRKETEIIQYAQCENSTITMNIAQYVRQEQKRNCEINICKVEKVKSAMHRVHMRSKKTNIMHENRQQKLRNM